MNTPDNRPAHIVIIGGGITGLSTAWYLSRQAQQRGHDLQITDLEASDHWGGKIRTDAIEGYGNKPFIIEAGPDSFLTQKPWAMQLARELGLEDRLLDTNEQLRKTFVLKRGRMIPLPDGMQLIVPTRIMPFALSPLLSPLAKLRMGMELLIPPGRDQEDETLADFVRRRLGGEALDLIAEPLLSGIYNADVEKQSLLATFPRFRAMEQEHGSLIRGMLAARKAQPPQSDAAKKPAMFASLLGGTQELVDTLVQKLREDSSVRLFGRTQIEQIERAQAGCYQMALTDKITLHADAVILTTPSTITASLIQSIAPDAAVRLSALRTVSTGTISLAYRRNEIAHPLDGFGVVIPRSEQRPINAITWVSTKFDHRAPDGYVLLRIFFGGSRNPQIMEKLDSALSQIVRAELAALMDITAVPVFERIYRWHSANPQYDWGHIARIDAIEAALPEGLYVTGSPYRGIGIPDCVHQAQQTAIRVMSQLEQRLIPA